MRDYFKALVCLLIVVIPLISQETSAGEGGSLRSVQEDQKMCGRSHKKRQFFKLVSKVAGGYPAQPGDFPSFVTIKVTLRRGTTMLCGGSLISKQVVLTAAHCLDDPSIKFVDISTGITGFRHWETDMTTKYRVRKGCISTKFRTGITGNLAYDFAVLHLVNPVKLSKTVQIACLPTQPIGGREALAVGAGKIDDRTGELARVAQVLPVKNVNCGPEQHPSRICFRSSQQKWQGDTCQGDSGGPIYAQIGGKMYTYGVTSYGNEACRKGRIGVSVNGDVYAQRNHIIELANHCMRS